LAHDVPIKLGVDLAGGELWPDLGRPSNGALGARTMEGSGRFFDALCAKDGAARAKGDEIEIARDLRPFSAAIAGLFTCFQRHSPPFWRQSMPY
jgi:hypothetical protein